MAYKRRKRFRRKKRKSFSKRRTARKNMQNIATYDFKVRSLFVMTGDDSNRWAQSIMVNYPFWHYTGSAYAQNLVQPPVYDRITALYRQYRVKSMSVKFIPRFTEAATAITGAGAVGVPLAYGGFDCDGPNSIGSASEASNFPSLTTFNPCRGRKWFIKNQMTRGYFYTGAEPNESILVGTQTPSNPLGSFNLWIQSSLPAQDPAINTTIGNLEVTYYIRMRGIDTTQI